MSGIVRGCGSRVKGAAYLEVLTSPFGRPLEDFLVDPPVKVTDEMYEALGLSHIGVKVLEYNAPMNTASGVSLAPNAFNVWDIVGERFYPNVCDILEEGRRFGFSRRIPRTLNFSLLTEQSRLILLHPRAWIENHHEYTPLPGGFGLCPKKLPQHDPWWDGATSTMCVGVFNEDIEGGKLLGTSPRMVVRKMPSFEYSGYRPPDGVTPKRSLAIFASFPIGRIVVIRDEEGGEHEQAFDKAKQAKLTVEIVEE